MPRMIEVQANQDVPSRLAVEVGDLLVFEAGGGHVPSGDGSVEIVGTFVRSVVGGGRVLAPMGSPNALVVRARRRGTTLVEVITGDPWSSPTATKLEVIVD